MFRPAFNKARNILLTKPFTSQASWLSRPQMRVKGSSHQVRRSFHPRHNNGGSTKNNIGRLIASSGGLTVAVALAVTPLSMELPREKAHQIQAAWSRAGKSNSIAGTREAAHLETRIWLSHYFRGDIVDEGTIGQDLVVAKGWHLPEEDTRVFYIPADSTVTTPVMCVSINYAVRPPKKIGSGSVQDPVRDPITNLATNITVHLITAVTIHLVENFLLTWPQEGRFERCCVIVDWTDMMYPVLYHDGILTAIDLKDIHGDTGIIGREEWR